MSLFNTSNDGERRQPNLFSQTGSSFHSKRLNRMKTLTEASTAALTRPTSAVTKKKSLTSSKIDSILEEPDKKMKPKIFRMKKKLFKHDFKHTQKANSKYRSQEKVNLSLIFHT
jgi:hypothetical protein